MDNNDKKPKQRIQITRGVSYVYNDYPYWDKEKKQTRHKREYVGKLDDEGNLIPNKVTAVKKQLENMSAKTKITENDTVNQVERKFCGATHLLDSIGNETGIVEDLKTCFPENYLKIISLAYYLVLETDSPMYRFSKWAHTHFHPFGKDISSQRISEFLSSISEYSKMNFFKLQSKRRIENEYLAYDITSISSYSELISQVKYGRNKDMEPLPQINLALVFGQDSMLPVYYRKLPGNITDIKTIQKLIKDIDFLDLKKIKLVMDRGFYSVKNINSLFSKHYKFLIAAKSSTTYIKDFLEKERESVKDFKNYDHNQKIYCSGSLEKWSYEEYDAQGKTISRSEKRIYVHIYYNGQRAEDEKATFLRNLVYAERNLRDDNCSEEQQKLCEKYFLCKLSPVRGVKIEYNEQKIKEHMKNFGYFVLLSNEIKNSSEALWIYRNKDIVEKAFGNLKNRLNMRRTSVSSSENLEGKLFLQFISLIYVSFLHKKMKEAQLYKNYSMQSLLDELDIIERYRHGKRKYHFSEITKKQKELYEALGFKMPGML